MVNTALCRTPSLEHRGAGTAPVWTGDMVDRWPGTWWTPVDGQLTPSISLFSRRWQGLWEMWETRSVFQVLWEGAKQLSTGRQLP